MMYNLVMDNEITTDQIGIYIKTAQGLGINTENPDDVRNLLNAVRYCELRFADPHNTDSVIAEKLGVSPMTVAYWKTKTNLVAVASQIVLAVYMNDLARNDTRRQIFASLQKYMPRTVENMMKIASGEGDANGRTPLPKDQIAAYVAIANTPIGQAYVSSLFVGESAGDSEAAHLEMRDRLASRTVAINLDDMTEGHIVEGKVSDATKRLSEGTKEPHKIDD